MVDALVALGIVPLLRAPGLVLGVGVRAVLREADDLIRVRGVEAVEELVVLLQLPQIPAEIQVIAVDVGNVQDGAVRLQHEDVGHGGGAGGVQLMAQLVKQAVVFQQVLVHGAGGGDLVGEAPAHDRGMVVALHHQFLHLGQGIGPAIPHVHGDVGELRPHHQALLVAQVVKFLGVLVVGQPDGVGPHLQDEAHVLLVLLQGEGIAQPLPVLVPGHPPQGVAASIQEKAPLGVHLERPAAEPGGHRLAIVQPGGGGVKVRIVQPVPQAGVFQGEHRLGAAPLHGGGLLLSVHGEGNLVGVLHPRLHRDLHCFALQIGDNGGDLNAGGAAAVQVETGLGHHHQLHAAVQPSIEGEVGALRVDVVAAVVHADGEQGLILLEVIGDIHPEGGVAPLMAGRLFHVQEHLAGVGRAVKFQVCPAPGGDIRPLQAPGVPAGSPVVVVAAVLAVHGVPGVGEDDLLALSPSFEVVHVFEKAPLVQGNHKGHK